MMTSQQDYINYFQNIAENNPNILHQPNVREAFFIMDDPYDLDELDEAVRNKLKMPCLILDVPEGNLTANNANNQTDVINGSFMVLLKGNTLADKRTARNQAKTIGKSIIKTMRSDSRASKATANWWDFNLDVNYQPVGPIAENYYGIMFSFKIICPFSL